MVEGRRLWRWAVALAIVVALALTGWTYATGWAPSTERYPLQGIDLGEHPPAVEWPTVRAAGADFAYIVATAGADRREASFEANWAALPDAGMRRGAVHLYSLCQPGAAQANAFNLMVPTAGDALPVAVDVSFRDDCAARPERDALVGELRRFATIVEAHTGKPLLLRVERGIERRYRLSEAIDRPVWAMANFLSPSYTARPWRLWRATATRRVAGVEERVNWDVVAP